MPEHCVGVIGATSPVARTLMPMLELDGWRVIAFTRGPVRQAENGIDWRILGETGYMDKIRYWVCLAPIWVLAEHFSHLQEYGVCRIVALSSTSRFTKRESSDPKEQNLAARLTEAEKTVQEWAEEKKIDWIVLRPTLIYGYGQDKNISEIARFIKRFGFFPLLGKSLGLRQPIHIDDVAMACLSSLNKFSIKNCSYNISGGEVITYREMVDRIFRAMGKRSRFVTIPRWIFRLGLLVLKRSARFKDWTNSMADRMNRDMVFNYIDAERDFSFKPRRFDLSKYDLPQF